MGPENLPEWAIKPFVTGLVLGVLALATVGFKRLSRAGAGEVRGAPEMFGCGVLCLAWVAAMLPLGLASDLSRPGQFAPWLALILIPAVLGGVLICTQWGVLARFGPSGIVVRRLGGRTEAIPWRRIRRVKPGGMLWSGAVFELDGGRPFLLSSHSPGAAELLQTAQAAGAPGLEGLFSRPDDAPPF